MKEAPFYFDGITSKEYDRENVYFQSHYEEYLKNQYTPLWEQKNNKGL